MTKTCPLCGYVFTSGYNNVRCEKPECQKEFERINRRERNKRYRDSLKVGSPPPFDNNLPDPESAPWA